MFTPCHTTIQSLTTCSKKVTDMILYAVSKEMAKQLLSTPSEKHQNDALGVSQQKKRTKKRTRKVFAV